MKSGNYPDEFNRDSFAEYYGTLDEGTFSFLKKRQGAEGLCRFFVEICVLNADRCRRSATGILVNAVRV